MLADALSRQHEPITLSQMTRDHLARGKAQPSEEGERRSLIEKARRLGHIGAQAALEKLRNDGCWWKSIRKDINNVITSCMPCQRHNIGRKGFHPLKAIAADLPWDHIAIDRAAPLPESRDGEDAVLVITDIFAKLVALRTLKGESMEGIAKNLWEVMPILGMPKIMQYDNGAELVNQLIEELVRLSGVDHRAISACNPRANGAVEPANRVIEDMLKKKLQGAMNEWPGYLPWIQAAYNAKMPSTAGSAPFSLTLGRRL